jgi:dimethylargininase
MLRALTHAVSPRIAECELTHLARTPIDLELAGRQHDAYCAALRRLGASVERLTGNAAHPDACFVEDTAIVLDELAILCSMGVASRRAELPLVEQTLSRHREVVRIELPATIEGGDVLRVGRRLFVGRSSRTNDLGIRELARLVEPLGYRVVGVATSGSLHLKSACTAIDEGTVILNPAWLDPAPLTALEHLPTPPQEPWSANVLRVGSAVCVQAGFPRTAELLARRVERLEIVDTSELRKAEAGLTCSSLLFEG